MFVQERGTTSGRQALGVALFWVPRAVWPEKPVDTGILLAEYRGYKFTNLSAPLPAEMYINGGWWLMTAGMAVLGASTRRFDRRIVQSFSYAKAPVVLGSILPFYMIIIMRGSLLQAMAYLAAILCAASVRQGGNGHGDSAIEPTIGEVMRTGRATVLARK